MDILILNGHDLTLPDVYDVAYDGRKVEIAADAYARLAKGREIMQELSKGGKAIYGFNRGVGQNKDVTIDEDFMETQNRMMLRSHSLGLPPFNTDEEVRAMRSSASTTCSSALPAHRMTLQTATATS